MRNIFPMIISVMRDQATALAAEACHRRDGCTTSQAACHREWTRKGHAFRHGDDKYPGFTTVEVKHLTLEQMALTGFRPSRDGKLIMIPLYIWHFIEPNETVGHERGKFDALSRWDATKHLSDVNGLTCFGLIA